MRLSGRGPVNSLSRITFDNNGKIRPQPDRENAFAGVSGGEGGIRTHGTLAGSTVFETAPFDHSGTSPRGSGVAGYVRTDFGASVFRQLFGPLDSGPFMPTLPGTEVTHDPMAGACTFPSRFGFRGKP